MDKYTAEAWLIKTIAEVHLAPEYNEPLTASKYCITT